MAQRKQKSLKDGPASAAVKHRHRKPRADECCPSCSVLIREAGGEAPTDVFVAEHDRWVCSDCYDAHRWPKTATELAAAVEEVNRDHPLPRCQHNSALADGAGERLEPPCGCRLAPATQARDPVPMASFGRDHWSTFGYIASCVVGQAGELNHLKMRVDANRHPGLGSHFHVARYDRRSYPSRLRGGLLLIDHDDWDCADDLVAAGLLRPLGTGLHPKFGLTRLGYRVLEQLNEMQLASAPGQGVFAVFMPILSEG